MDFREMTMDDLAVYRFHVRRDADEALRRADAAMAGKLDEYKAREAAFWQSAMQQISRVLAMHQSCNPQNSSQAWQQQQAMNCSDARLFGSGIYGATVGWL